jgi:hypothetical protein
MVVEILIAHRHAENALAQQLGYGVLDEALITEVAEARRELLDHPGFPVHFAKEEHSTISAELAAPEIRHHFTTPEVLKSEGLLNTFCHAAGVFWLFRIRLSTITLHQNSTRPHHPV